MDGGHFIWAAERGPRGRSQKVRREACHLVDRGHGGADAGEHRIANGLADSGTHGFRRVVSLHALVGEEECNRSLFTTRCV